MSVIKRQNHEEPGQNPSDPLSRTRLGLCGEFAAAIRNEFQPTGRLPGFTNVLAFCSERANRGVITETHRTQRTDTPEGPES